MTLYKVPLVTEYFQTRVNYSRKEFLHTEANNVLHELTPIGKGTKLKMAELLPLMVSLYLTLLSVCRWSYEGEIRTYV